MIEKERFAAIWTQRSRTATPSQVREKQGRAYSDEQLLK